MIRPPRHRETEFVGIVGRAAAARARCSKAHLWEREMLVKVDDAVAGEMYVPGVTIKLSKTPGRLGPVPTPGQHTDKVLRGALGYDGATINALRQHGAVK